MKIDLVPKILLIWYFFIFLSTEILSYFHQITSFNIQFLQAIFLGFALFYYRNELNKLLLRINFSKTNLIILTILTLTFIQGFFSAPSTTDSMVYHLPKVMYWVQEQTVYQDIIRNPHDFKAPFAEYIVMHLYLVSGSDKLAFFSQWIAFAVCIYLSGVIARQLGAAQKLVNLVRLFTASLPIALMQSASTQVDLIVTVLFLISLQISLSILEKFEIKKAVLLSLAIGLGFFTKATFFIYLVIPSLLLMPPLFKAPKKAFILGILILISIFLIQSRFFMQNYTIYGNFLGSHILSDGSVLEYTNKDLTVQKIFANTLKNLLIHIPFPVINNQVYESIVSLNNRMGLEINEPDITCCGTEFKIAAVIYPQEDIVSNTFHLLLIFLAGIIFFRVKDKKEIKAVYILSVLSFILFSAVLKWQPYHSRLEIPMFIAGSIASILLTGTKNLKVLYILLVPTLFLAFAVLIFNVSRPYVSYSLFYDHIKQFSKAYSVIPEAFYIRPRTEQYFNAEYFWYEPYKNTAFPLRDQNGTIKISFDVMDDFEYPLWVLLKENKINFLVIPKIKIEESDYLIKTSKIPEEVKGFIRKECYKTVVDYGYACLYKKLLE